jgi:PAS domain S-box-containing protein
MEPKRRILVTCDDETREIVSDALGNANLELHFEQPERIGVDTALLEDVLALTQTLVSSLDIQEILYKIVTEIAALIEVERVSVVLVPDRTDVGFVVATSDDPKMNHLRLDLGKYPEIQHVLASREPLTIEDVQTHPLLDAVRSSIRDADLSALTLIPIVSGEHAMGVLFIRAASHRGALSPRQMAVCRALVDATAIALRNATIMQSLREETRDISDRHAETEKQIESLRRYADVFDSSAEGIAVFDEKGDVLLVNPGASNILGFQENELLGQPIIDVVFEEDRPIIAKLVREMFAGVYPDSSDVRVTRKDGEVRTINCSFSSLSGAAGAILVLFRDVTETRRRREEAIKTKDFLESLIATSVDAIVATDRKGKIILYNEAAERIYGWPAAEVINQLHVTALYAGAGAREVGRMLRSDKFGGVGQAGPIRMEAINSRGETFPISLTAAFIYQDGEHTATFGIFHDLRERVRMERELALAQEKLAISEKQALIAELAGATAHELNQPLTGVIGYAELLARSLPGDSTALRAAEKIRREAERMAEIVRKIGKLTKYETRSYVGGQRILDLDRGSARDSETETKGER